MTLFSAELISQSRFVTIIFNHLSLPRPNRKLYLSYLAVFDRTGGTVRFLGLCSYDFAYNIFMGSISGLYDGYFVVYEQLCSQFGSMLRVI